MQIPKISSKLNKLSKNKYQENLENTNRISKKEGSKKMQKVIKNIEKGTRKRRKDVRRLGISFDK